MCAGTSLMGGNLILDGSASNDCLVCGRSRGLFVVRPKVNSFRCINLDEYNLGYNQDQSPKYAHDNGTQARSQKIYKKK